MSDELAAQGDATSASAPAPAAVNPEIEKVRAEYEARLKGLQGVIAKKDQALAEIESLRQQIEEQQLSSLSPDERVARREKQLADENAQLRARLELAELRKEYGGKEFDLYTGLLEKSNAKEQLDYVREFLATAQAAASTDAAVPPVALSDEATVPDVDMNNPMRQLGEGVRLPDGTLLTDQIADMILGSVSRQADITQS